MLKYLVGFARDPIRSRRRAAIRVLIVGVIFVVGPAALNWCIDPRAGLSFNFGLSGILVVASLALLTIFWAPAIVFYSRPRRQRERYLARNEDPSHFVSSVYLTPNLLAFIESKTHARVNPYVESLSLVFTPTSLEFWSGDSSPLRTATLDFAAIETVRFVDDEEHFRRPEIGVGTHTVPLYAAVGLLRVSRRSSRTLWTRLIEAVGHPQTM
jgi:hypothetical protein